MRIKAWCGFEGVLNVVRTNSASVSPNYTFVGPVVQRFAVISSQRRERKNRRANTRSTHTHLHLLDIVQASCNAREMWAPFPGESEQPEYSASQLFLLLDCPSPCPVRSGDRTQGHRVRIPTL